mmetsp:Transcript_9730/g.21838  ORF Transcript_9730/g.21838 Transcript_9730/m.21838 type:complete len:118 (-) Transcript_9730:179-532(-)
MFSELADDTPKASDIGVFIAQPELEEWWEKMQKDLPQVFTPGESCPQQVSRGTKLRAYFDGDKSKPMDAVVLGSKFKLEFADGKYPMYVVRYPPQSRELSYIHLTTVGEEDGWEVVK